MPAVLSREVLIVVDLENVPVPVLLGIGRWARWVKKWAVFDHEDRSLWDFFVALSPRSSEYLEATHSSLKRDLADNRIAVLDKDSSPEADTKLDNTDAALKDRMMKFVDHQKKYVLEKEQKGIIVLISSDADFEDDLQAAADAGIECHRVYVNGKTKDRVAESANLLINTHDYLELLRADHPGENISLDGAPPLRTVVSGWRGTGHGGSGHGRGRQSGSNHGPRHSNRAGAGAGARMSSPPSAHMSSRGGVQTQSRLSRTAGSPRQHPPQLLASQHSPSAAALAYTTQRQSPVGRASYLSSADNPAARVYPAAAAALSPLYSSTSLAVGSSSTPQSPTNSPSLHGASRLAAYSSSNTHSTTSYNPPPNEDRIFGLNTHSHLNQPVQSWAGHAAAHSMHAVAQPGLLSPAAGRGYYNTSPSTLTAHSSPTPATDTSSSQDGGKSLLKVFFNLVLADGAVVSSRETGVQGPLASAPRAEAEAWLSGLAVTVLPDGHRPYNVFCHMREGIVSCGALQFQTPVAAEAALQLLHTRRVCCDVEGYQAGIYELYVRYANTVTAPEPSSHGQGVMSATPGGAREATSTLKVTCRAVNAVRPYPSAPAAPVEMWVRQSFPAQDAAGSVHFPIKGDAFAYGLVNFSSADAAAAAKAHVKQLDETRLMHSTAGQMFEWQLAIEFKPVPKARRRQFLADQPELDAGPGSSSMGAAGCTGSKGGVLFDRNGDDELVSAVAGVDATETVATPAAAAVLPAPTICTAPTVAVAGVVDESGAAETRDSPAAGTAAVPSTLQTGCLHGQSIAAAAAITAAERVSRTSASAGAAAAIEGMILVGEVTAAATDMAMPVTAAESDALAVQDGVPVAPAEEATAHHDVLVNAAELAVPAAEPEVDIAAAADEDDEDDVLVAVAPAVNHPLLGDVARTSEDVQYLLSKFLVQLAGSHPLLPATAGAALNKTPHLPLNLPSISELMQLLTKPGVGMAEAAAQVAQSAAFRAMLEAARATPTRLVSRETLLPAAALAAVSSTDEFRFNLVDYLSANASAVNLVAVPPAPPSTDVKVGDEELSDDDADAGLASDVLMDWRELWGNYVKTLVSKTESSKSTDSSLASTNGD